MSVVLCASFLGMVLMVPLMALLVDLGGWRVPFGVMGLMIAVVWWLQWVWLTRRPGEAVPALGFLARFRAMGRSRGIWYVLGANACYQMAAFGLFTYFAAFLIHFRILAHHPILLRHVIDFGVALRHETRLNPVLRDLAILTGGRLTHCAYESTHHAALALRIGVRPVPLERLATWESAPAFTPQERAVIRYAAEATQQVAVAAATFEALRTSLDDRQLLDLVLNVAFSNMIVRVLMPLEVELEPDAHENRYRLDQPPQGPGHDG